MTTLAEHPARDLPELERIEYLTVVASIVLADHEADAAELGRVEELCRALGLGEAGHAEVKAAATQPDRAVVDAIVARLKHSPLRVALLTDAIVVAFADGKVASDESREISRLGRALDIKPAQIGLIGRYVESVLLGKTDEQLNRELGVGVAAEQRDAPRPSAIRWLHRVFKRG